MKFPIPRNHQYNDRIDDALQFIDVVHAADCLSDPSARRRALDELGDEIVRRNEAIFFSGVMNQAFSAGRSEAAGSTS